ncbi:MAG: AAA family ATPase [Promethearchaeota archaeon]
MTLRTLRRKPKIIFEKISGKNFGPYFDYFEIKFSNNIDKNVTLITGDIGSGKTSIFQLFWWVLFPKEKEKDKEEEMEFLRSRETINVVNEIAIKRANIGDNIEVLGSIQFRWESPSGNKKIYNISRKRIYKKIKDFNLNDETNKKEILQYVKDSDSFIITKGGEKINFLEYLELIAQIFPKAIRKFVFIHGEGMTRILSIENVAELKKSVLSISDYPKIKGLKEYIKACIDYFDKKRENCIKDNNFLMEKRREIEEKKAEIEKLEIKLEKKEKLYEEYHDKILDIENDLQNLEQNKEYIEKYNKIQREIENLEERKYGNKRKNIKGLIKKREEKLMDYAPYIYLEEAIDLCRLDIKKKREFGIIPGSTLPKRCLQLILEKNDGCICGTAPWTEKMRKTIENLIKNSSADDKLTKAINNFETSLIWLKDKINEGKKELFEIQKELENLNNELNNLKNEKVLIERSLTEEELKTDTYNRLIDLTNKKNKYNKTINELDSEIRQIKNDISELNEELKRLNSNYNKEETIRIKGRKDAIYYRIICEKLESLEKLRKNLEEIIGTRIREETQIETENILIQLVKDPDNWQSITIKETNSGWEINAKFNDIIITNISTGMTNILGLSFIFALSSILGVNLPLIFDSPFGNLDDLTRELIAENLPPLFKGRQIIFFEKKINLFGTKINEDKKKDLYPVLKKYIEYEYEIENPSYINAKIKTIR